MFGVWWTSHRWTFHGQKNIFISTTIHGFGVVKNVLSMKYPVLKMSSVKCPINKKVFLLNIPTREGCGLLIKTGVYIFLNNHFHPPRPSEYDPLFPLDVKHVCAENIFLLLRFEIIFSAK